MQVTGGSVQTAPEDFWGYYFSVGSWDSSMDWHVRSEISMILLWDPLSILSDSEGEVFDIVK
jgi:hypothetical protein